MNGIIIVWLVILGLVTGSFLNVVIVRYPQLLAQRWRAECREYLRLPVEQQTPFNLAVPRSHCVHCRTTLTWKDLIPVLSFICLKGRCRQCHVKISWQYPIVEICSALIWLIIALRFGLTIDAMVFVLVSEVLLVLAFIDLNTQLLPDDITLSLLWSGLVWHAITEGGNTLTASVLGAVLGYVVPWLINFCYRHLRQREGMGYGDFKCFAALGAWLGLKALPSLFILAVIGGLIFSLLAWLFKAIKFQQPFPFGPSIIFAGWLMLVWPDLLQQYFNQLFY